MISEISGAQLRAARALLNLRQRQIAERLGVSVDTVARAESDRPGAGRTKRQLLGLLQRHGVEFYTDGGIRYVAEEGAAYRTWRERSG